MEGAVIIIFIHTGRCMFVGVLCIASNANNSKCVAEGNYRRKSVCIEINQ